jgi:uncharacterized glyoxalase superfamily protein PhnB
MRHNRSIPSSTVIPVLSYPDVREAVTWLTASFGFAERVRIGEAHRAQMSVGDAAVIIADTGEGRRAPDPAVKTCSVTVRVADVQVQRDRAAEQGGTILMEPTEFRSASGSARSSIPGGTTGRSRRRSPTSHLRTGAAKPSTPGNPTSSIAAMSGHEHVDERVCARRCGSDGSGLGSRSR